MGFRKLQNFGISFAFPAKLQVSNDYLFDLRVFNYQNYFVVVGFFNSFIFTGPAQALKTEATQEQTVKGTPDLSLMAAFGCIRQTDT